MHTPKHHLIEHCGPEMYWLADGTIIAARSYTDYAYADEAGNGPS